MLGYNVSTMVRFADCKARTATSVCHLAAEPIVRLTMQPGWSCVDLVGVKGSGRGRDSARVRLLHHCAIQQQQQLGRLRGELTLLSGVKFLPLTNSDNISLENLLSSSHRPLSYKERDKQPKIRHVVTCIH